MVRRKRDEYRAKRVGIEAVAYQTSLVQEAIAAGLPAVGIIRGREGKEVRALMAAARYEAGAVYHPEYAPWKADFENELVKFPRAKHDDQVDCVSDAAQVIVETPVSGKAAGVYVG